MHVLAAQGREQKRKACMNFTQLNLFKASGIVMEIHCHITGICEPPMSSSLFSVILSWFSKVLLFLFVTTINSPNLYAMWLISVALERSAETKVWGGGGQALFVINGLPHQSFVYSECSGATDWFMYHLRSNYKNCLEFPFKVQDTETNTLTSLRKMNTNTIMVNSVPTQKYTWKKK